MTLFPRPTLTKVIPIALDPGHFYDLSPSHIIAWEPISAGTVVELIPYPASCMFTIHSVKVGGTTVGLAFSSSFTIKNGGGYLLTYLNKSAEAATDYTLLLRTPNIVVYGYPNCGALAISPKINQQFQTILEEQ